MKRTYEVRHSNEPVWTEEEEFFCSSVTQDVGKRFGVRRVRVVGRSWWANGLGGRGAGRVEGHGGDQGGSIIFELSPLAHGPAVQKRKRG